jgi:Enoyl-(Acyl carrier protein) reductase
MRSTALECALDGITINAVLPGNVLTEGLRAQGEEYLRQMVHNVPMQSLAEPRGVGYAAAFLASEGARYITGQTLVIDGGNSSRSHRRRWPESRHARFHFRPGGRQGDGVPDRSAATRSRTAGATSPAKRRRSSGSSLPRMNVEKP